MRSDSVQRLAASYSVVLQSKRLLLQGILRRLATRPDADLTLRAERLHAEVARAAAKRARLRVRHGDIDDPQFWIDAYGLLIQQGEDLAGQLRNEQPDGVEDLPLLDGQLELWRSRLRDWMLAASA